jgi:hypothetical protein
VVDAIAIVELDVGLGHQSNMAAEVEEIVEIDMAQLCHLAIANSAVVVTTTDPVDLLLPVGTAAVDVRQTAMTVVDAVGLGLRMIEIGDIVIDVRMKMISHFLEGHREMFQTRRLLYLMILIGMLRFN